MKSAARRVVLEVLGWGLLLAGIAMLALPGPGLLGIFAGMFVLSQQYEWAERRLDYVRYQALKGAAESVENWLRIAVSVVGVLGLVAFGVLWWVGPAEPDWWPLPSWLWLPGGIGVSFTLWGSAVIALALLVYSYRRFHGKPEAVAALSRDLDDLEDELHGDNQGDRSRDEPSPL